MVHGLFHADPHPGNVMLLRDGRLALLDYGSVGRLDATTRAALQRVLMAADSGDPAALRDALMELVVPEGDVDEAKLERALGQYLAVHLGAGSTGPDLAMFTALLRLTARFGLAVPPEVAAVFRSLVTLDGTLTVISPGFDLVEGSRAGAFALLADKFSFASLRRSAADEALAVLPMLRRLPAGSTASPARWSAASSRCASACCPTGTTGAPSPRCSTRCSPRSWAAPPGSWPCCCSAPVAAPRSPATSRCSRSSATTCSW
ncbi:AarF/UbiB family protein [Actinokineospora soli]|uniref:AarF/UbiB family protein n=1 Tax=Actinokineospora soli TaxID=1048753 RepID=A0ABW2TV59_9PSEU